MNNEQQNENLAPPESSDAAQRRRERMLAFHLGALCNEETDLIRGRLETDPDWQRASADAQAMLKGLMKDGQSEVVAPDNLGLRVARCLREHAANAPFVANVKNAAKTPLYHARGKSQVCVPLVACPPVVGGAGEQATSGASQKAEIPLVEGIAQGASPVARRTPIFLSARLAAAIFLICALPIAWQACRCWWSGSTTPSLVWRVDNELAAGAPFAPCVLARDVTSQRPLIGARVTASLSNALAAIKPITIFEGVTDATGVAIGDSKTIADIPVGDYDLVIEAKSSSGDVIDRIKRVTRVTKAAKLALAPDRSQARPGETIRARALLASSAGNIPINNQPITLDLLDPAGNRIGRLEKHTSKFGLAWSEFPLDTAAPEGVYTLYAESGNLKAKRAVEVKQYKLPPFKVTITSDKPWFKPSERLTGRVEAQTFDGHPIANVKAQARLCDDNGKALQRIELSLDNAGVGNFDFGIANALLKEYTQVQTARVEVSVTDGGGRSADGQITVRAASSPYIITVVPEAGELVAGVQNCVYVIARTPDNQPARVHLRIFRDNMKSACDDQITDEQGVAMFYFSHAKLPAEVLQICASPQPFSASEHGTLVITPQSVTVPIRPRERGQLLMRMEKAIFRAGETIAVKLYAGEACPQSAPTVSLALRQNECAVASAGATLKDGKAETRIRIPQGVVGVFSLEAALVLEPNKIWTDSRMLSVTSASGIKVVASADRPKYRPGDRATLDFRVSDAEGNGIPAAVSVVANDDALLALTGENPGLAQALQAAGVNVLRDPNFPLDPTNFTLEQSESYSARAALAKATMISVETNAQTERSNETIVDNAATKLAEVKLNKAYNGARLKQWLLCLAIVGVALLVLLGVSGESSRAVYGGLSALTAVLGLLGFAGVMLLDYTSIELMATFWLTLAGGHIWLLIRASKLRNVESFNQMHSPKLLRHCSQLLNKDTFLALKISTLLGDGLLGILFWVACHENACVSDSAIFVGLVGLFIIQMITARPRLERNAFAISGWAVVVLLVFVLPFLLSAPLSTTRRAREASGGFLDMAKDYGGRLPVFSRSIRSLEKSVSSVQDAITMITELQPADIVASFTPPHLRFDFPETMIFAPQIVTDEQGRASFQTTVADSLTRWRVQTDAIAAGGGMAWTQSELIVTQPFSVDLDLPPDVTVGDILQAPVIVSNHTNKELDINFALSVAGATSLDGLARQAKVAAKSITSVVFTLRFDKIGEAEMRVNATASTGGKENTDAVARSLKVLPDGKPTMFTASMLAVSNDELDVNIPDDALPGTIVSSLKLHRGPLTQMIEGLESMLREPHGCFEQTSSATYPNIMILRYLRANGINKPDIEERARDYIARGYQRLLSFEVGNKSGGFSLYGQAPASAWLTAYGLLEFSDMATVCDVDPALLERMRRYLRSQMNDDGSFKVDSYRGHESSPLGLANTAYIALALKNETPSESAQYLRRHAAEINKDAYLCALCSNALLHKDRALAAQLASNLRALAQFDHLKKTALLPSRNTLAWGYGDTATVETSALGALALLETGENFELASMLLAGMQSRSGAHNGWGSTHATVLALKALERAAAVGRKAGAARIVVEVNGKALAPIELPAEESATPVSLPLNLSAGKSKLRIWVEGGPIIARVNGQVYVPWQTNLALPTNGLIATISYDATTVKKSDMILGTATLTARDRRVEVPMLEWGMPAGFAPNSEDLNMLKQQKIISRWEISGRKLRLYLPDMQSNQSVTLSARFRATASGEFTTQASRAFEYYRSAEAIALPSTRFVVGAVREPSNAVFKMSGRFVNRPTRFLKCRGGS